MPTLNKTLNGVDLEMLSKALRSVVVAVTDAHTSDCLLYAHVGAAVLEELGELGVEPVAGSAVWRVGSGDSGVIAHAFELQAPMYAANVGIPAIPFHAWISMPGHVLDFTTWTLRDKARMLDELDGGSTTVDWAPEVLFASSESVQSIRDVQMAASHGAYAYVRHGPIEKIVRDKVPNPLALQHAVSGVLIAYRRMLAGLETRVIGVDAKGGLQSEPPKQAFHRIM